MRFVKIPLFMRSIPTRTAFLLAPAFAGLALSLAAAPRASAACLPTDPSSTCDTFTPDTASNLVGRTGFSGVFNPDVVQDPLNAYAEARVKFRFTGSWTSPFTLGSISITGNGITTSLSYGGLVVTNPTNDFDDNRTGWQTLDSSVSSLDFANSSISYVIPAGAASVGSTIQATIEYRSGNQAQLNSANTTSLSTAVPNNTVPGPLPLFGVGAAFAASRKLRQRVRAAG